MIFSEHHVTLILSHHKTQTRRVCKPTESLVTACLHPYVATDSTVKWQVGNTYAIQPARGAKAVGRIEITGIRQEKVQDITTLDCSAEGYPRGDYPTAIDTYEYQQWTAYEQAWDSINKRKGTRWQDNPTVFVLEFRLVEIAD